MVKWTSWNGSIGEWMNWINFQYGFTRMMVANATHILLEQVIIEDSPNSQAPTQGGRSCAGARGAPAEKFGLGRKF